MMQKTKKLTTIRWSKAEDMSIYRNAIINDNKQEQYILKVNTEPTITKFTAENNVDYVILFYEGVFNKVVFEKYAEQVMDAINDLQCYRILVDFRKISFKISTYEIIEIHKAEEKLLKKKSVSIKNFKRAIVSISELNFFCDLFFIRAVSLNPNLNFRQFVDFNEAVKWLTQE